MIKVDNGIAPNFLSSNKVTLAYEKMETFYASPNRMQKRYRFPFNKDIDRELKKELHKIFYGKCGYCEINISSAEYGIVDRFRPHNGVRDKNDYYQDLYWWLNFDWDNLIYSCKECNQYKANYFPITGNRALNNQSDLDAENNLLINPTKDEPNEHFYYDARGLIISKTNQGDQTVELLRLNERTNLIELRIEARKEIIRLLERVIKDGTTSISKSELHYLKRIYENDNDFIPFFAYKKWVLLNELGDTPLLGEILKLEDFESSLFKKFNQPRRKKPNYNDLVVNDYFPIEYIYIKNFKSIEELRIDFREDDLDQKSWLILLGENGVGKSSILQAIAVGLNSDTKTMEPIVQSLIKKRKQKAEIEIKERNSNNIIRTILNRKEKTVLQTGNFNSYLMGYGSLRLSTEEANSVSRKDTNKVSYENLFNPIKPLNDITKWLKSIHKKDIAFFDRIAYSIKQLLPHDFPDNELTVENSEIMFKNSEKIFSELSDGFKSTITLAVDIMMKLSNAQSDMDKMSGVVLIDELGNQLHPRWQMRIITQLRSVFPNINFIISTHHPLCLRGTEKGEILLLKNIDGEVVGITELPDPSILRVDQILASEFFGLSSLVDPEIEAYFNRYYELLAKNEDTTQEEKEEINHLQDKLRGKRQLGASLREELMYSVIDKLLAQEIEYNKMPIDRDGIKTKAIERVKEVWRTLNLDNDDRG